MGLGGEIVGGPEASGTTRRERQRRQEREGELASAALIEALQASGSKRAGEQASGDGASERRWGERGEEGEGGGASHSEEGGASERLQASKRGGGSGGGRGGGAQATGGGTSLPPFAGDAYGGQAFVRVVVLRRGRERERKVRKGREGGREGEGVKNRSLKKGWRASSCGQYQAADPLNARARFAVGARTALRCCARAI